jgi:hypothetical protein
MKKCDPVSKGEVEGPAGREGEYLIHGVKLVEGRVVWAGGVRVLNDSALVIESAAFRIREQLLSIAK